MGEGKEGGGVTVCEDDDGAAFLGRRDDNEVQSQTNFQDEDREKKGEENVVCSISSGFFAFKLQFCRFFECSCGFLAFVLACFLFFVSYAFPLFLILLLWCHF